MNTDVGGKGIKEKLLKELNEKLEKLNKTIEESNSVTSEQNEKLVTYTKWLIGLTIAIIIIGIFQLILMGWNLIEINSLN